MSQSTTCSLTEGCTVTPVDAVGAVDPYDARLLELVGVDVENRADGSRYVLLTSCGGDKVEFRVPAGNAQALADAILDAAEGGADDE